MDARRLDRDSLLAGASGREKESRVKPRSPHGIRIGYLSTMYHTSILIKGMKWLENRGVRATWQLFGTGPAIVDAITKNRVDLGYIGLAPTMIGIGSGVEVKCIAGGHVEGTVIIGKSSYKAVNELSSNLGKALKQFRGKRVGAPRRGSLHDVFLRYYLSQYELKDDVEVLNYDWADFIPDAMIKGEVEGAAGTPPLAVLSSRLLGAKVIVPPQMIWPSNPSYGIVTSNKVIRESPELLESFLKVHKKACYLIREEPRIAAKIIAKTIQLVEEDAALETIKLSPKYCAALSDEYVESTLRLVPLLRKLKYLSRELTKDDIFSFGLIKRVHPEPQHYHSLSKDSLVDPT